MRWGITSSSDRFVRQRHVVANADILQLRDAPIDVEALIGQPSLRPRRRDRQGRLVQEVERGRRRRLAGYRDGEEGALLEVRGMLRVETTNIPKGGPQ